MTTPEKKDQEPDYITYHDIFALALAYTRTTKFVCNYDPWHQAIYEICQKYKDSIPELRLIGFERKPPLPPQSQEVYELRMLLGSAGLIWDDAPYFKVTHMPREAKKKIRDDEKERLRKYEEQIRDMAQILEKYLSLKK